TRDDYGSVITPTASIVFDASDPITHTTSILFYTQGPDDPSSNSRVEIGENGNLRPTGNNRYALGEPGKRWTTVYTVNGIDMSSDGRLKDNITTLPYGLEQIKQLQPVEFTWKDAPVDDIRFGLIAQDVLEVLPEIVSVGDDPAGLLSMNYTEIVPVLVSAIQEQQGQIESQEEQILALEARLSALESAQNSLSPRAGLFTNLND
ncbi:MAG: tail fiber domain-containing protein, partial [Anaerolineales bacterium]|nr:tail fiber domain-containing protein [Anaerolineales bacterium]